MVPRLNTFSGNIRWRVGLGLLILVLAPRLPGQTAYSLDDCIRIALQNNPNVTISRLRAQSANAEARSALSNILPTVDYSTQYFNRGEYVSPQIGFRIPAGQYYSAGLSLRQNIFDGGKWWNQIAAARKGYRYSLLSETDTRVTVVLEVKKAFYQYLKDLQLLEVARQSVELAQHQVELVKRQYEVEAVAKTDLLKQQVRLGEMEVEHLNQQAAVKNSFNELARVMGLSLDADFSVIDSPGDARSVESLDALWQKVKSGNSALLAKKVQIMGSELSLKAARAGYLPSLSASLTYDGSADMFDQLFSSFDEGWRTQILLSVSYPLFTGLSQSSQVEVARVDYKIRQAEYDNLLYDLQVQLDFLFRQLENLKEMTPIFEATRESAEEDLRLVQERYNLGAATILDVLDAQLSVARANSSLVSAIYDRRILEAQLDALMGKM